MEICEASAVELRDLLASGEISSREVAEAFYARIDAVEPKVHAFLTLTREEALSQADAVDKAKANGDGLPPWAGVPVGIKDNMCTRGVRTTCASRILENFVPPYDGTAVAKTQSAGLVPLGKLNMDEFAMGSSTENSAFGPTRNPWDLTRVPGGSSGGSAAAVAAREVPFALGSDTGGSIRQPAACCGVVGMKPTYGLVSRYGLVAFASSLDQIGPLSRTVTDSAALLNIVAGHDARDSTSLLEDIPDYTSFLVDDVRGMKIGMPREYFAEGIDQSVKARVREAIDLLAGLGAEITEVSLPHTEYGIAAYYLVATAEASSNLARYDGVKYGFRETDVGDLLDMYCSTKSHGFGAEVQRRIMLGTYGLSSGYYDAYYLKAQKVRTLLKRDFENAFAQCDCLVTPTSPTVAFGIGERVDDPLHMYLADVLTVSASLAGLPGMSVPCGLSNGLPVGMQILAPVLREGTIFRVAYTYECHTDHHRRMPMFRGDEV